MNPLSPVLRLEVGGVEVFREFPGPVLLVATPTAPLDAVIIAAAVPGLRRWNLRRATGDTAIQRAQVAAGNSLLAVSAEDWLGELALSVRVPVIPVGVRGGYAVGDWSDIARRRIPRPSDRPRVAVRFGVPLELPTDPTAARDTIQRAVDRLVAEDETTWWDALRSNPGEDAGSSGTAGWRATWAVTGPMPRGGAGTRRRIWR